jgi:hypothetical protein
MRDREKPERGDARSARRKALLGVLASGPAMIATLSAFDALKPYGEYLTRIVVGYEQASAEFWGCVALQLSFDLPFSPGLRCPSATPISLRDAACFGCRKQRIGRHGALRAAWLRMKGQTT